MPTPKQNEKKEDYMKRCMIYPDMQDLSPAARFAKCNGMWEQSKIKKMADIRELFVGNYEEINNVEILNQFHNAHGIQFTDADMEQMVFNYKTLKENKELSPNVKISHSDQQLILQELFKFHDVEFGEELPNVGILENFRLKSTNKGKAIVADIKKIPKVLKGIYGGLYTSLSPEIIPNWREGVGKVIRGIVLSNNPSQKHIPDVYAMSQALRCDGNIIFIKKGGHQMNGSSQTTEKDIKLSDDQIDALLKDDKVVMKFADKMKSILGIGKKTVEGDEEGDEEGAVKLSAAEFKKMKEGLTEINELKKKLIEKEERQQNFSDTLAQMKQKTRKETADAICSKAMNDGVPKSFVEKIRPILMSDLVENTIKLSHIVDDKMVEADTTLEEIAKDLLVNYPGAKIEMADKTSTSITPPSEDKMKKLNARAKELRAGGMSEHEALTKAGEEIL